MEEALAGRAENLKEYTLALEVFDKAASHDPGADSIVRVEARRLREARHPPATRHQHVQSGVC